MSWFPWPRRPSSPVGCDWFSTLVSDNRALVRVHLDVRSHIALSRTCRQNHDEDRAWRLVWPWNSKILQIQASRYRTHTEEEALVTYWAAMRVLAEIGWLDLIHVGEFTGDTLLTDVDAEAGCGWRFGLQYVRGKRNIYWGAYPPLVRRPFIWWGKPTYDMAWFIATKEKHKEWVHDDRHERLPDLLKALGALLLHTLLEPCAVTF